MSNNTAPKSEAVATADRLAKDMQKFFFKLASTSNPPPPPPPTPQSIGNTTVGQAPADLSSAPVVNMISGFFKMPSSNVPVSNHPVKSFVSDELKKAPRESSTKESFSGAVKLKLAGGEINGKYIEAYGYPKEIPGSFRWYRSTEHGDLVELAGVTENQYLPSLDDVGSRICSQWFPHDGGIASSFADVPSIQLDPDAYEKALKIVEGFEMIDVMAISVISPSVMESESIEKDETKLDKKISIEETIGSKFKLRDPSGFSQVQEEAKLDSGDNFVPAALEVSNGSNTRNFNLNCESRVIIDPASSKVQEFCIDLSSEKNKSTSEVLRIKCRTQKQREILALAVRLYIERIPGMEKAQMLLKTGLSPRIHRDDDIIVVSIDLVEDYQKRNQAIQGLEHLQKEVVEIRQKLNNANTQAQSLSSRLAQAKAEKSLASTEMNRLTIENSDLSSQLSQLQGQSAALNEKLEKSVKTQAELEGKVKLLGDTNESIKKELMKTKDELQTTKESMKIQVESAIADRDSAIADVGILRSTMKQLSENLAELAAAKKVIDDELELSTKMQLDLKRQVDELTTLNDTLRSDLEDSAHHLNSLKALKDELSRANEVYEVKLKEADDSAKKIKRDTQKMVAEKLETKLEIVKADRDRLKSEMDTLEQNLVDKAMELEKQKLIILDLHSKYENLDRSFQTLQEENNFIREKEKEQFKTLEANTASAPTILSSIHLSPSVSPNGFVDLSEKGHSCLQLENKELREKLEGLINAEEEMKSRLTQNEQLLIELRKERDELSAERNSFKHKATSLAKDMEKLLRTRDENVYSRRSMHALSPSKQAEELEELRKQIAENQTTIQMYKNAFEEQIARATLARNIGSSSESMLVRRTIELELLAKRLTESLGEKDEEITHLKQVACALQEKLNSPTS